jgi:sugar lactone lactonase YvrE
MVCPDLGVGLLVGLVCVVWGVAPASATRNHIFGGSIGSPGSGAGQLSSPESVAVDNSAGPAAGDVYVADTGNARVDQFDSSGHFVRAWGWGVADGKEEFEICTSTTTCRKGIQPAEPTHSKPGQFDVPQFIAVDGSSGPSEGDVYVADGGTGLVQKFTGTGELVSTWGNGGPAETPNGQLNGANAAPTAYPHGSTFEGPFHATSEGVFFDGIAIDGSGNLWVYAGRANSEKVTGKIMFEFDQSSTPTTSWSPTSSGYPAGIAVDSSDNLYFSNAVRVVFKFSSTGSDLGVVNHNQEEEQATGLAIDPSNNEFFIDVGGKEVGRIASSCESALSTYIPEEDEVCSPLEVFGSKQLNGGTTLAVASASETVYAADPSAGSVYLYPLEPAASPRIESQTVSSVTSSSATFNAGIDPRDLVTEYHFEYGPTTSYGETVPTPDVESGSDFEVHEVSSHVQDLLAGRTYHYRVVAHNDDGTTYGEDQTFLTQVLGSALGLPDGRMYEMVTPPAKEGALILGPNLAHQGSGPEGLTGQAAADGSAIMDLASRPTEAEPLGNAMEVAVLSTRGSSGWSSRVIAPPHERATFISIGNGEEYRFLSEDLSQAIVQPFGPFIQLAPEATESTAYLHTNFASGDPTAYCQSSCFKPLVTASNIPAGTVFGEALPSGACPRFFCGPQFLDATPDLSHVIVSSPAQLTSASGPEGGLYEWTAGRLQLISAPPEGQTGILRLAGSETRELLPTTQTAPGERDARHAISNNGERVILAGGGGLYLRDLTTGELIRLDVPQGGAATSKSPSYMTASTDASRIFFLDNAGLTSESSAAGMDLYEYDLDAPAGHRLTDLTVDGHGEKAADVEAVIGASNDGSYVYFVAAGALAPGASPGGCILNTGNPLPEDREACNIYVRHDGVTQLVTGNWNAVRSGEESARVSPDGHWLAFMSSRDLTGYDTRDSINGRADQEVYLYDADAGKLVCPACNPTGARPVGRETTASNLAGGSLPDHTWAASNVPPLTSVESVLIGGGSRYQPRYLSDAGRLFFDSNDALVPQDVNGNEDVYEYEPSGIGSCTTSSVTFAVRSGGCVSLVSSGSSAEESAFVDASETGGDAFFITYSKLLPQDFDNAPDVYDAHECTTNVPCYPTSPAVPPVCATGDACKAAPTPQPSLFGPAPSATFSGVGNVSPPRPGAGVRAKSLTHAQKLARALRACRKRSPKQRATCRRAARKRFGPAAGSHKASAKRKGRG